MMKLIYLMSILLTVLLGGAVAASAAPEEDTAAEQPTEEAAAADEEEEGTAEEQATDEVDAADEEGEDTAAEQPSEEAAAADEKGEERKKRDGIEELFVTAEKREGKLQETPIAITAITQEFMEQQVVNNPNDYTLLIPSFSFRAVPNRAFIRGIGRNVNTLGLDPGVAIYNDGVYTSETAPLSTSSFGTERIEVLRGPQGTLYGRSATGGAVNVISEKPSDEFRAKARVIVGNLDSQQYGLIVTGPIGGPIDDRLRYHLQFNRATRDGYIDNLSGKSLGSVDDYFVRGTLEADITDDLNIWVQYDYLTYERDGGNIGAAVGLLDDPYATTTFFTSPLTLNAQAGWPVPNPTVEDLHTVDFNDVASVNLDPVWAVRGQATWDIGPVTLKYIGGYTDYDWESIGSDLDKTSNPDIRVLEDVAEKKQYTSSELQLLSNTDGNLQWLAGFYYYHEEIEQPYKIYGPDNARMENVLSGVPNPERRYYFQKGELKTNSYAVFGEASYDFLDYWSVTAGIRYSYDEKEGKEFQQIFPDGRRYFPGVNFALDFTNPDNDRRHKSDWSSVSGRFVLQYMPIEEVMLYASFTSGYKPGGFNLGALQDDPIFDDEQVFSYELGAKTTLLDNHMQLNGTFFYYDYRDLQVARASTDPGTSVTTSQVLNADEASVFGVEFEGLYTYDFDLLWVSNITLSLGYSFLHARYDDFCCSEDQATPATDEFDLSGNPLTQSPDHKVTTSLRYGIFTDVGEFALTGRFSWVDDQLYGIFDDDRRWGDDYHRTDLFASWTKSDIPILRDVTIIGFVKNLEDDQNLNHVQITDSADLGRRYVNPNLPRTYGLEFHLTY
jgi:iron complex outermembrane receptor protein